MRKKPLTLSVVAVVAVVLLAAVVVWIFPVLRVNSIEVSGTERVSAQTVLEDSGIVEGDNLLRIDASGAASRIAKQPWVRG